MSNIKRIGSIGGLFFLSSIALYYALTYSIGYAFDLKKAIPFIRQWPIVYISAVTVALVFIIAFFDKQLLRQKGHLNFGTIVLFLFMWLLGSIILGGIVWAYHDLGESQYIGGYSSFTSKALKNISDALVIGPMILLAAFPYNLLCLIILHFLVKLIYR